MDKERVEELLKQYFSQAEEGQLLSPEKDRQLQARLKSLAEQEEDAETASSVKVPIRQLLLVLAASLLIWVSIAIFPDELMRDQVRDNSEWKVSWIADVDSMTRGDELQRRIRITAGADGYFAIACVDPNDGVSLVFPFSDGTESKPDNYELTGPFKKGEELLIPPEDYTGFELEGLCLTFLIPSENEFDTPGLADIRSNLQAAIDSKKRSLNLENNRLTDEDMQVLGQHLRSMLTARYPGTIQLASYDDE